MKAPVNPATPVFPEKRTVRFHATPQMTKAISDLSLRTGVSQGSIIRTALTEYLRESGFPGLADLPTTRNNKKGNTNDT